MASDSDTEEYFDASEDVIPGAVGFPSGSPSKTGFPDIKETDSIKPKAGNEPLVQELKQDVSKKIIDSIIEESQKVQQLEDEPLGSTEKEHSDSESTVGSVSVGTDLLSNIPGLLTPDQVSQDVKKRENQSTFKETSPRSYEGSSQQQMSEPQATENKSTDKNSAIETENITQNEELKHPGSLERVPADLLPPKNVAAVEERAPVKPPRHTPVEPDIVASTKKPVPARPPPPSHLPPPRPPPPVRPAPPPRKKKNELELETPKPAVLEVPRGNFESGSALTPSTTFECQPKDAQPSLDLASATSGNKIVTDQENGKAPDGQTVAGETMGPQRPRSNSGRELTDEEILASVMIKNLDTGEEIPLSLAEEKLPTGINPLTLHIMRRTKEYVSNDAAQSDDEEKIHPQQTDTDGGRLKQKTVTWEDLNYRMQREEHKKNLYKDNHMIMTNNFGRIRNSYLCCN